MLLNRSSGILLHISSLPGKYGTGSLGKEAEEFISFLKNSGIKYWQILPMGPVSSSMCYSPYSSTSAFAGNPLFISIEKIMQEEWFVSTTPANPEAMEKDHIDFKKVEKIYKEVLELAWKNFQRHAGDEEKNELKRFCEKNSFWLEDYCLYEIIAEKSQNYDWRKWGAPLSHRAPQEMATLKNKYDREMEKHQFIQFIFQKQWKSMKEFANSAGIKIIGDIPIYMSMNSADAWARRDILQINRETLKPLGIAGVPPDYFSETGQLWGNPLYKWKEKGKIKAETMDWWMRRISRMLELVDLIRIDHFRGLESYWSVKPEEKTAIKGKWVKGPGRAFFTEIKKNFGEIPLIAEDLGIINDKVKKLRDDFKLPGMKILQFAFDFKNENAYLPHNIEDDNCVLYTGTHDNNTTNGWFYEGEVSEEQRQYIMEYLGIETWDDFHWKLIRAALRARANLVIFPAQDLLGYGKEFRMNTPSTTQGNWSWKLKSGALTEEISKKLLKMNRMYSR